MEMLASLLQVGLAHASCLWGALLPLLPLLSVDLPTCSRCTSGKVFRQSTRQSLQHPTACRAQRCVDPSRKARPSSHSKLRCWASGVWC